MCRDIRHNDTEHNDILQTEPQCNNTQRYYIQLNNTHWWDINQKDNHIKTLRSDPKLNDTQQNDTQQNNQNNIQQNDTRKNDTLQNRALRLS
jgi:hypothetical protein